MTLQRLHGSLAAGGKLSPGVVIVLDEAGAVGLDDMVKLFELARRDNCRVILSGDTGQHTSRSPWRCPPHHRTVFVLPFQRADDHSPPETRSVPAGG